MYEKNGHGQFANELVGRAFQPKTPKCPACARGHDNEIDLAFNCMMADLGGNLSLIFSDGSQ